MKEDKKVMVEVHNVFLKEHRKQELKLRKVTKVHLLAPEYHFRFIWMKVRKFKSILTLLKQTEGDREELR